MSEERTSSRSRLLSFFSVRRRSLATELSIEVWATRGLLWVGAVGVGLAATGFAYLTEWAHEWFGHVLSSYAQVAYVLVPLGAALVVYLTRRWFPGAEGSGIPQTIAAIKAETWRSGTERVLGLRVALAKIVLGSLALACGMSTGREGPTVQIGAAIMLAVSRLRRNLDPRMIQQFVLAGGAAGISAAFNTPLAGIVFAIEELSRNFESRTSGATITAVILAGLVSLSLFGNYNYFGRVAVSETRFDLLMPIIASGVLCGVAGGLLSRALIAGGRPWPGALGRWRRAHPVLFAAACGVAVVLVGIASGDRIFGSGYLQTVGLLEGAEQMPWYYGLLKLLATYFSYISGVPGGIFAPSLAVGAGFGSSLTAFFPDTLPNVLFALCMVGFLAAVTQAPITSFVIVMEMIDGHALVLSLMATALLAKGTSTLFSPSLYRALSDSVLEQLASRPPPAAADARRD